METVKIATSQNIKIGYEVAGLGSRVKARAIDYGLFFGVYMVAVMFFVGYSSVNTDVPETTGILWAMGAWLVFMVFYDLIAEIFFNGQSVGKRVAKIKVISLDGARPSVGQYILRWIFRLVDFGITMGSLAIVTVSFSDKKQRIGDMVAGTTVISTQPKTQFKDLVFSEPTPDHVPTYQQVMQLTDRDISLIYEVIKNFNRTRNSLLIYKLAMRVKAHLHISYPPEINEYRFLEMVVNDYKTLVNNTEF